MLIIWVVNIYTASLNSLASIEFNVTNKDNQTFTIAVSIRTFFSYHIKLKILRFKCPCPY